MAQVTADGVPVIWHDDLVRRQTADGSILSSPVSTLTLAEFQRIYEKVQYIPWLGRRRNEIDGHVPFALMGRLVQQHIRSHFL